MNLGPTLITARLILRPPTHEDLDGFASMAQEEDTMRFIGGAAPPWRPGGKEGGWPGDEVGWGLKRAAMGKGYAAEGATAAIDWAFDHLGWDHVIHCIDEANAPSIALALRLGSKRERENIALPAPFDAQEVDICGQSRAQWRARPRA